jgi:hypothetical protein
MTIVIPRGNTVKPVKSGVERTRWNKKKNKSGDLYSAESSNHVLLPLAVNSKSERKVTHCHCRGSNLSHLSGHLVHFSDKSAKSYPLVDVSVSVSVQ